MAQDEAFDAMADRCILAAQAVMSDGSDELRVAMRLVLRILGHEIAQRTRAVDAAGEPTRETSAGRSSKSRAGNASRPGSRVRAVTYN